MGSVWENQAVKFSPELRPVCWNMLTYSIELRRMRWFTFHIWFMLIKTYWLKHEKVTWFKLRYLFSSYLHHIQAHQKSIKKRKKKTFITQNFCSSAFSNCDQVHDWEGGMQLCTVCPAFFPTVRRAFSHHTHTAGIDPLPTPSLLQSLLWFITHKVHLTFTQQNASLCLVWSQFVYGKLQQT